MSKLEPEADVLANYSPQVQRIKFRIYAALGAVCITAAIFLVLGPILQTANSAARHAFYSLSPEGQAAANLIFKFLPITTALILALGALIAVWPRKKSLR